MSGTRPEPGERRLAEQHLGDRLSALVDGELGHDARERVLAHLATCAKCKAEADAQRQLKSVFAEAAPPSPSESFLARLQGLPGGDLGGSALGGGGFGGFSEQPGDGPFGTRREDRFEFGYVPARPHTPALTGASAGGFRVHSVGRPDADRPSSRGLRFAFVAAGAVSLAAIALGGVTVGGVAGEPEARGSGSGSNVTPARSQGSTAAATPETQRRRGVGPLLVQGQGQRAVGDTPAPSTSVSAPLLPGPVKAAQQTGGSLTTPVDAVAMSPLIRPLSATPPLTLTTWRPAPEVATPGLAATPVPGASQSPSVSPTLSGTNR
ncbi:zf-HC2 domain-containing protein [Streptomyces sp. GXMU-J15]|uniref:Zf-HC2 domain-containing protein n=1 Tax=Streptomyces fuscus TaxID=3048495 RepID=A0ABT7J8E2_9ACTN|nr:MULTISPECIES: zf-HC2 domain-containing protein [Streptomyces]MDL2081139.1 zf-HC2 domain-containing protein [Streptomyces fuscus]SBT93271.1 Putative zinc-finger [Streptomyces sp. DI166]